MIKDLGGTWVITGHSERRHILGESDLVSEVPVRLRIGERERERALHGSCERGTEFW